MPDDALRLIDVAGAVSDGAEIDWEAAESATADEAERAILRDLRVLARVGALHRSDVSGPAAESTDVDGPGSHADRHAAAPAWGPLRLLERIGDGRFGEVYRAWDPRLDREVALKLLRGERAVPAPAVIREARLLARVRHPNVVTVHGADVIDGRVGLWMEFIRGETLADAVRVRGPFGARDATAIGVDLCRALAAVHEAGLVHRDLKPQNVMREPGGRIVLMDFGAGAEESSHRATHGVAGTPLYLATELFEGGPATVRSDIYSLGVLLYFLVSGTHPVTGGTADDLRAQHALGARARLREARPELPAAFAEAVDRALEPDPSRRFESASAFETALACSLEREVTAPAVPRRTSRRRKILYAAAAASLVMTGVLASWRLEVWPLKPRPADTALNVAEREWVLVTSFENRTGDAMLDGTIEAALERELAASSHLRVVPRARVADVLRLMKRPENTPVDAGLAREVALRDGDIRTFVSGRIDKAGPSYLVGLQIVDPATGVTVDSSTAEARGQHELLATVRRQSIWLRERLGETVPAGARRAGEGLSKVTTPSLQALHLYSRALAEGYRNQWRAAELLLRDAIRQDPEFASAHIWLAMAIRNQGHTTAEWRTHAARATELAGTVPERERYFITGSAHWLHGRYGEATSAFESLVSLSPDHDWARNQLGFLYSWSGRVNEAAEQFVRQAALRPNDLHSNVLCAQALAIWLGDAERAGPCVARAQALATPGAMSLMPYWGVWAEFFPAYDAWRRGDIAGAAAIVDRLGAASHARTGRHRDEVLIFSGLFSLALGRIAAAERSFDALSDAEGRHYYLSLAALARGDVPLLRQRVARDGSSVRGPWPRVALLTRAGFPAAAESLKAHLSAATAPEPFIRAAEGAIMAASGRSREATASLERAVTLLSHTGLAELYLSEDSLASLWIGQGELRRAAGVLEETNQAEARPYPTTGPTVFLWIRNRARLARLYRDTGRFHDARAIEARLRRLLALADTDHPVLRALPPGDAPTASPRLAFAARDFVLLTVFENRTGEALLDGTIENALERELANSRFVNVAPRVRIEDTLRLMGRPPDTLVDTAIGREISQRDGGIRAMVGGRIERMGASYVLGAIVRDPIQGDAVASVSEEAPTAADLPRALLKLSNGVREALGEPRERVQEDNRRLERVTTPSLTALRLYSESSRLGDRGEWRAALELAKQAVREDPDFASAHIWLAWALRNTRAPKAEVDSAASRAMQLVERTAERERYWIVGSYHYLRSEYEQAAGAYEALSRLYPDHRWAVNNLLGSYRVLGRADEAAALAVRTAELRPNNVSVNYGAAVDLARSGKFDAARRYFARVTRLTTNPDLDRRYTWIAAYARLAPAYEAWFKRDARGTLAVLDRLANKQDGLPRALREDFRHQIVPFYLALGRVQAARRVGALLEEDEQRHMHLALAAFAGGDLAALRDEIGKVPVTLREVEQGTITTGTGSSTTFMLAVFLKIKAGFLDDAQGLIEDGERHFKVVRDYLRGDLALARGDVDGAIVLLRRDIPDPTPQLAGSGPFFRGAESLAAAHLLKDEVDHAANVLRAALARRREINAGGLTNDFYRVRLQVQLAELDRRLGREAEARALEERLARLLAVADPDFPLAVRLRRLREAAASTIRR